MPSEAARKQAHLEWYNHTDEESWSDDVEKWRELGTDEYLTLLAQQEAILDRFERDYILLIGPPRPDAEQRGANILRRIGKTLKHHDINVAALLVNRPLFDLVMRLWDIETRFLIHLFPNASKQTIDTHRLSEMIALHTMAQIAVSSPDCIYRERLVSIDFIGQQLLGESESLWHFESASVSTETATSEDLSQ